MPPTVLFDRYTLLEPAGSGGSAEVWRARDEQTGDEVAVKRLHPVVFADVRNRRRLEREFAALHGLDERHIVRVRDLHVSEREAALVLDFIHGDSLAQRLAGQSAGSPAVAPEEAAAIVSDVAAALSAAHAAGIVHRDVTPGNILLATDGEARLTDFGIAHASGDTTAVTATGLLMGTMRYLAPEQLRGGTSTPASDLHGLAAVAYEMFAGHPAYDATSPVALAEAQQAGPAPIGGMPVALDAAIRRGLAVDPADRPADVGTFAASIAAALQDEPTVAIPIPLAAGWPGADPTPVAPPVAAVAAAAPRAAAGPLVSRPPVSGRHRVPAPVALGLGLVIAAAALVAAMGADRPFGPSAGAGAVERSTTPAVTAPTARPTTSAAPQPTPTPKPDKGKGKGDNPGKGDGNGPGKGNGG